MLPITSILAFNLNINMNELLMCSERWHFDDLTYFICITNKEQTREHHFTKPENPEKRVN